MLSLDMMLRKLSCQDDIPKTNKWTLCEWVDVG